MNKQVFSKEDVEKALSSHQKYDHVQGCYLLSCNTSSFDHEEKFFCTENQFQNFINEIIDSTLSLSFVPAKKSLKEWAALPGEDREKLIRTAQEGAHVYKDFLQDQKDIVVITKVKDDGRSITWLKKS